MRRTVVAVVLVAGCGRLAFEGVIHGDAGDAAASDAGDAAAGDDAPDAAPACLPGYRVCDGFEAPGLAPSWTVVGGVSLDGAIAHRGAQSVRFHADAVPAGADRYVLIAESASLAAGDPTVFVRAWVRLGALPANNMGLIAAEQGGSGSEEVAVFVVPELGLYSQFSDQSRNNNTQPPANTWFCVIWQIDRSTTASGALAISGDQPAVQLANVITDGVPALRDLAFGIQLSGSTNTLPQPAFDVWVDDVIVSPTAVTCAD